MTEEHKKKISIALTGTKRSLETREKMRASAIIRLRYKPNHPNYRADDIGYNGLHQWLRKTYGNPVECELCEAVGKRVNGRWTLVWALIKGFKYERKRGNFFGLCISCHRNYDKTQEWNDNIRKSKQ